MSLHFDDAVDLAAAIRRKEVSSREVLAAHLRRIEDTNPAVNAIVTLDVERASAEAAAADDRLAAGEEVGPLHGLPIAHKDLTDTAGLRTTYGSPLFAEHVPTRDDPIITRLRAAGVVTVGKTNTPELGLGSHTFNPVFGVTRNPYALDRSAGGSSGGAAAALAAGMIPIADGSDTGGSLRNPASFCNVVGLRPSPGRVRSGPSPTPWPSLSTKGPMGRTVADTALLMAVLAGDDSFAAPLHRDPGRLRVAWTPDLGGLLPVEPAVIEALEPAVRRLQESGADVVLDCPDLAAADEVFRVRRAWQLERSYGTLLDQHREALKPDAVRNIEQGRALTDADLDRADRLHTALQRQVAEFFTRYDALLAPVSQVVPFDADLVHPTSVAGVEMSDYLAWMGACSTFSATHCPALSVPAAFTPEGLPVGLQIVGPLGQDRAVLEIGAAIEEVCRAGRRRPPEPVNPAAAGG
ncbi:amidase [Saccharopolyspora cebuensis]|uniref:Amidase n=1 Tax=Saccharopolyspora cebuensis TaxID=418759 RepID=A0ABV4CK74_9PSEU